MFSVHNAHTLQMTQFAYEKCILIIFWYLMDARKKIDFHHRSTHYIARLCAQSHSFLFHLWSHEIATTFILFFLLLCELVYTCLCVIDSSSALWRNDAFIIQSFSHPINRYFDIENTTRHQLEHVRVTNNRTNRPGKSGVWIKPEEYIYMDDTEPLALAIHK